MSHSLKLFVVLSVLLNLLLLGIVGGQICRQMLHPDGARRTQGEILASLSPEKKEVFVKVLTQARHAIDPLRAQSDDARRAALCILETDPFDPVAYRAKIAAMHTLHQDVTKHIVEATIASASQFSPQERIALVDLLRPPPPALLTHNCLPHQP